MKRKDFLKKGLTGLGTLAIIPTILTACSDDETVINDVPGGNSNGGGGNNGGTITDCSVSPNETAGPFPIKSPADLVRESIIGDRAGVPFVMNLTIQDKSQNNAVLNGVFVDVWHCDAEGNYSQYGGTGMQQTNYTGKNFLRGRQTTNANGQVSFVSVFPGWYRGRAPHIHLEVLDSNGNSLKVTQIAFPKDVCDTVYATSGYQGTQDTLNENDNVFSDSGDCNMLDKITGNTTDGYTLIKTIIVE